MTREPTYEQLLALGIMALEHGCHAQGIKRIGPADRASTGKVALVVEEDGDDWLFRTYDRIPTTELMGS